MAGHERLERYLSIRMAWDGHPTHDGRIVYLSNMLGVPTPFVWDGSLHGPEPLRLDDIRTSSFELSPTGSWVVLSQDEGGSERHQLVAVNLTTRERRPLTHRPESIHLFGAFFPDGEHFALTANRRNGRDFELYIGHLDGRELEPVQVGRELEGVYSVPAVYPDGQSILLAESVAPFHQRLFRVDLDHDRRHGALTLLTPEDPGAYHNVRLQGTRVLATSDRQSEYHRLIAIEEPGVVTVLAEAPGDIELLAAASNGTLAYTVNRQGLSELHVLYGRQDLQSPDAQNDQVIETPAGVIAALRWSPDGDTLVFDVNRPSGPSEVYRLSSSGQDPAAATRSYRAGFSASDFIAPELLEIESFDGLKIPAWYYRARSDAPSPAVIAVHGGPEGQARPIFSALYQYWLSLGVSVLAPNVRGSTGYGKTYGHLDDVEKREDALRDLEAVTRHVAGRPEIDAERVVVYGGSYGGYMVMAGLTWFPEHYRAGVELVGIVNLESFLEKTSPWRRALREAEYGSLARDREVLKALSPIHRIDRLQAPLFIGHGRNDPRVPYAEAEQVAAALQSRGVPHELFPMDDEGHGAVRLPNQRRLYGAIADFLAKYAGFPHE